MSADAGLEDAIRHYVGGFSKRSGIQVELEVSPRFGRISQNVESTLLRVVQESLTNIHRHSGSRKALIRLDRKLRKDHAGSERRWPWNSRHRKKNKPERSR
jgi:signal transduction histidine kinase